MLVNRFCVNNTLSCLDKLAINSFISNGYSVRLWTYTPDLLETQVSSNVDVQDADQIIPKQQLSKFDALVIPLLFKYALLHTDGGTFVDNDVVCLKKFDDSNVIIAPGIITIEKNHKLMIKCFCSIEQTSKDSIESLIKSLDMSWAVKDNYFMIRDVESIEKICTDQFDVEDRLKHLRNSGAKLIKLSNSEFDFSFPVDKTVYARLFLEYNVDNNKVVNALWIGNAVSLLEKLTIQSFIDHGHEFVLWTYNIDDLKKQVPSKTILKDAGDIIPKSEVFQYDGGGDCAKGSYGGFSDIFRYELLYRYGGWYVDMDVTCLKPFIGFTDDYVFRPHHLCKIVANIIKCPARSKLMDYCRKKAKNDITKKNTDWHKPIQILSDKIFDLKLDKYVVGKNEFGDDGSLTDIRNLYEIPEGLYYLYRHRNPIPFKYAIHWCNDAFRSGIHSEKIDWTDHKPMSVYRMLLKEHKLIKP